MNRLYTQASVVLVVLLCLPTKSAAREVSEAPNVAVAVSMRADGNQHHIYVRLTNNGSKPFTMYTAALPWKWRYAMIIVPVVADLFGTVIQDENQPIDDPVPQTVTIRPAESIEGTIDLDERISKLRDTLQKHDVLIFWSYEVRSMKRTFSERVSGVLTVVRVAASPVRNSP